ncbi:ferredoxin [Gordonia sp. NPDC003376]
MTRRDPRTTHRLVVDWTRCDGHGLCAVLVPEHIRLDEWGFPVVDGDPVRPAERRHAHRAVAACPALALRLGEAGRR